MSIYVSCPLHVAGQYFIASWVGVNDWKWNNKLYGTNWSVIVHRQTGLSYQSLFTDNLQQNGPSIVKTDLNTSKTYVQATNALFIFKSLTLSTGLTWVFKLTDRSAFLSPFPLSVRLQRLTDESFLTKPNTPEQEIPISIGSYCILFTSYSRPGKDI